MSSAPLPPRSSRRLDRQQAALLLIDLQEKLLPGIASSDVILWNAGRLLRAARLFDVPIDLTEQYPQGLGPTVPSLLQEPSPTRHEKRAFSAAACGDLLADWAAAGIRQVVIAGIESHVCVLQSCLDLLSEGFDVLVVVDAIGARCPLDHETAVRRMRDEGATLLTTESVLFEWCESSADPQFKSLSALVRESPPAAGNG